MKSFMAVFYLSGKKTSCNINGSSEHVFIMQARSIPLSSLPSKHQTVALGSHSSPNELQLCFKGYFLYPFSTGKSVLLVTVIESETRNYSGLG